MASIISSLKRVSALMLAGDILCFKNNFICFIAMIRQLNGGKLEIYPIDNDFSFCMHLNLLTALKKF